MSAMTAQRAGRGLPGGWLSMAPEPERDTSSSIPTTSQAQPATPKTVPATQAAQASSSRRASLSVSPTARRKAQFELGGDDSTTTSAMDTPVTPQSQSGSSSFMSPVFDARASFAPMVFQRPKATQPRPIVPAARTGSHQSEHPASFASGSNQPSAAAYVKGIVDDGQGIEYGGRRWKGKTAHAVEQEMEIAGDTTVMSYAPDAVYLASRLEGLRRNLEAGGEALRGRRWIALEDDEEEEEAPSDSSASGTPSSSPSPLRPRTPDDRRPASLPPHITDLIPPPSLTINDDVALAPLDPAAKAAALESRVEIRLLRRSDLEQVRDLHCLHGDNGKADTEHYVTSAAFLLRLLVDEGHVCLVAVAKPIPAPTEPFPSRDAIPYRSDGDAAATIAQHRVPRCPPPSMDMPPSSAAYVFAARGISTNSPYLRPTAAHDQDERSGKRRKQVPSRAPASSLGRHTPMLGSTLEEGEEELPESDADSTAAADDTDRESLSPPGSSSLLSARLDDMDVDDHGDGQLSTSAGTSLDPSGAPPLSPFEIAGHRRGPPALQRRMTTTDGTSSLSTSPLSLSSNAGMAPKREYGVTDMVLAGPTNEVAPPRAMRVMIPPAPGAATETETILGVASAQVTLKPPTESLWGEADAESSKPRKEIHVLTLSVAKAERGLGLGGKLLDELIAEATRRNVGAAYRAAMGRRSAGPQRGGSNSSSSDVDSSSSESIRTFLQVHAESSHALKLYRSRGFEQKQRLMGYFRGDTRIPAAVRSMPGGNDALLLERYEAGP